MSRSATSKRSKAELRRRAILSVAIQACLVLSGCVTVDAPPVVHSGWVDEVCRSVRIAQFDGEQLAVQLTESTASVGADGIDLSQPEQVSNSYEAGVDSVANVVPPEDVALYLTIDEAASALISAGHRLAAAEGSDIEAALEEYQLALTRHRARLGEINRAAEFASGDERPRGKTIERLDACPNDGDGEPCRGQLRYLEDGYRCVESLADGASDA